MKWGKKKLEAELLLVKIIQCSDPAYWYREKIGGLFLVEPVSFREFYIVYQDGAQEELQLIRIDDCQLLLGDDPPVSPHPRPGLGFSRFFGALFAKLKKRAQPFLALSLAALLLLATAGAAHGGYAIRSLYSTFNDDYLGAGFNSISKTFLTDDSCLDFSNIATETVTGTDQSSAYCFVDSQKELDEQFRYHFGAGNAGPGGMTALSPETGAILRNTSFSADTITLFAYWRKAETRVFSTVPPKISDAAFAVLQTDPRRFFRQYGDQYVSAAILGKIIFLVYQADAATESALARNRIKRAMELKMKQIFGVKLTEAENRFVAATLARVSITRSTYGNGVLNFNGIDSAEDLQRAIAQIATVSVIARELRSYSQTSNGAGARFYDSAAYLNTVNQWERGLSNLNYIATNPRLSSKLRSDCQNALNVLNRQLNQFYSSGADLQPPDRALLEGFYDRYLAEMNIAPRTYQLPAMENRKDLDLRGLRAADSLKLELVVKQGFFSRLFNRNLSVVLYLMDGKGGWSEYRRIPLPPKPTRFTLYEGTPFRGRLRLAFSKPKLKMDFTVYCSYTEQPDDIILLQKIR
ncbi:hypothetical protein EDC14_100256 [Hydrogenispora ethanolica]|uniref:Uncharacterized protein n=1 Tax=Hydrogenispora ethanolica TaxID=1082276 RepID=A0A4R1S9Y0_HYDET|nr:hypothetical protein [Hydrogenispora ethanolica]TCL76303.1 hypothetical protein EDC14_100256 [Hydrogenispora ethanolica]